jgi:hypothetical protein
MDVKVTERFLRRHLPAGASVLRYETIETKSMYITRCHIKKKYDVRIFFKQNGKEYSTVVRGHFHAAKGEK